MRTMMLGRHAQLLAMTAVPAAMLAIAVACGRVDDGGAADSGATTITTDAQSATPDGSGGFQPIDAAPLDSALPDGGTGPVVACGDASADGSTACLLPPSDCVDEHTMRYYASATCDEDAGLCAYQIYEMHCPASSTPPDCYQGGCRITIIR